MVDGDVLVATSRNQFLAEAAAELARVPVAVLLDVQMPELTGLRSLLKPFGDERSEATLARVSIRSCRGILYRAALNGLAERLDPARNLA
ncbi:MAG: hypothetical protein HY820_19555 [Acidobacteria bacterium]|nr:hypothetical protein [Acidobacteriota bacterium]